jgi:hypothetical protein
VTKKVVGVFVRFRAPLHQAGRLLNGSATTEDSVRVISVEVLVVVGLDELDVGVIDGGAKQLNC